MDFKSWTGAVMMSGALVVGANDVRNLLQNAEFDFHAFGNHRNGKAVSYEADYVPCWNASGNQAVVVRRDSHIDAKILPPVGAANGVMLKPGAKFSQFFTLPEANLIPGERLSFLCYVHQTKPEALSAAVKIMKIDSEDGEWSPKKDFNFSDKRTFVRQARGELVVAAGHEVKSKESGMIPLKIDNIEVIGKSTPGKKSSSKDINTVGIEVKFTNTSDTPVWIFRPSLVRGIQAAAAVGELRPMPEFYRHIPRTMQKLWKGEPLHIIVMGSSIDRGSANPPLYPYNEDPASPDFKKPLCDAYDGKFSAAMAGRPELDMHLAQPRHFYSYAGRLKAELMRKFNCPADKILLNFMACDGSCIGESHSGLREYCELAIAPNPEANGHKGGKTWQELYPALFARPEGTRPDLVIYGSGANEKTDTPDEGAVFEGAIRFIQRNYPGTEFVFCVFQNYGGYTPNPGDLQAIALRYGVPFLDYGLIGDRLCRTANRYAVVNADGHPQAATHYLWFKQLEKAFEAADPIKAGFPQQHMPERMHPNTYNWEGEMKTYSATDRRIFRPNAAIIDDSAFNLWGTFDKTGDKMVNKVYVNGVLRGNGRANFPKRDLRNSLFRFGNLSFGDRHVVELDAPNAKITALDCKVSPERRWIGVESGQWKHAGKAVSYESATGFPYGSQIVTLKPGESAELSALGNGVSIAWADMKDGGDLKVKIDGKEAFTVSTAQPLTLRSGEKLFVENRKGVRMGAYGVHTIQITADKAPVSLMGAFVYDMRSNRSAERVVRGMVSAGDVVEFTPPFQAVPVVTGVPIKHISKEKAEFAGNGMFEAAGE